MDTFVQQTEYLSMNIFFHVVPPTVQRKSQFLLDRHGHMTHRFINWVEAPLSSNINNINNESIYCEKMFVLYCPVQILWRNMNVHKLVYGWPAIFRP